MKTVNTFGIQFIIRGDKLKNGKAPIYARITVKVYIMEIVTTLFRAKLTQGLADFWVAANAIKARTKIVI
jgi:hypothetical protein